MKKFLLIALFLGTISLQAQIDVGFKAGVNFNSNDNLNIFGGFAGFDENFSSERKMGFTAGVYATIDLSKFYVQPELLFAHTKSGYDQNPDLKLSYIELPALIGYNVINDFSIYAGPSLQFLLDDEFSNSFELDFENKTSLAFNFGARFLISKFGIDLRYLTSVSENLAVYVDAVPVDGLGYSLDTRSNQFVLTVSYQLN